MNKDKKGYWFISAARLGPLLFLAVFFFYPLVLIVGRSLTAAAFLDFLRQSYYGRVVLFTTGQAALSTLLTLLAGLPVAYLFARTDFPGKSVFRALITLPFVMPTVVVAAAFRTLLGSRGLINQALIATFNLSQPPIRLEQTLTLIVLAHVFYNIAVVVRLVGGFWANLNPRLEEAAANYTDAITYARQQISLVPWQEQAYRQLITAHIATGQSAAALAQFATLKQVLADKLHAEPGAEIVALINRVDMLSDRDFALLSVPTPYNPWLDDLSRLLLDPVNRLVTVIEPTGAKPTDLAQALAWRLEKQFTHGVHVISLADCDPADPETIIQTIAAALRTQHSVLSYLRPRHILLILYPFTPFIQPAAPADGVTLVMNILQEAPQVTMMVVASRSLQLQQEIVYRL